MTSSGAGPETVRLYFPKGRESGPLFERERGAKRGCGLAMLRGRALPAPGSDHASIKEAHDGGLRMVPGQDTN